MKGGLLHFVFGRPNTAARDHFDTCWIYCWDVDYPGTANSTVTPASPAHHTSDCMHKWDSDNVDKT